MGSIKPLDEFKGNSTPLQEKQWVRKVREESDPFAFERIFRSYYKRLHGFAHTYVKDREDAEDIVQTIFLKIWTNKESWDPPGKVKHYLFAAVRNEALNFIRHKQLEEESEEEISKLYSDFKNITYDVEEDPVLEELRENIQKEIDQLPSRCKEIYLLNRRSGLTYTEIADYLDISINTVETQMGRALKVLRKNLSDYLTMFIASGISKIFF